MTEDWTHLESEINATLAAIGAEFAVALPRDVLDRTRVAVRVGLDEAWLDERLAAQPTLVARRRLRAAVNRELHPIRRPAGSGSWVHRNAAGLAALSAAAMLAFCVGVIHYAASLKVDRPSVRTDPFERFLTSASVAYEADPLTASLEEELEQLEESVAQWPSGRDSLNESLQKLEEMMDGQHDSSEEKDTL